MINHNDYYYKGYDVSNKNSMEKRIMEMCNPYGYNFGSNLRRVVNLEEKLSKTNQDMCKLKGKR